MYYNFIYILKKKENTNEHITKHNLRILKPLPIPKTATYGYYCEGKMYKANNAELNIDNIETIGKVLNIENKGWFNDKVGSYCASLVNIVEANYPRTFVARAYIKVTSNDGIDYVYSQDNGDEYSKSVIRTIKGIANSIFKDKTEFNGYSDDEKSLIKKFAGIVDTAE